MSDNETPIPIDHFDDGDDIEFRIKSKMEMLFILQGIIDQGTRVTLHYNNDQDFFVTSLLGIEEDGMWLDFGTFTLEDNPLLLGGRITFVSTHQQIKIQFVANNIYDDPFEDKQAFYLELPPYLLRILRREFFRTTIPADEPVTCIIPIVPHNPRERTVLREVPILDISGDGVGLLGDEHEEVLLPEKIFRDCKISIPRIGELRVTIVVRNGINFTAPDGVVHKRLGCSFILMDSKMNSLLQRYIFRLQGEAKRAKVLAHEKEQEGELEEETKSEDSNQTENPQ
jgi:c-di-GMP-binding flagellar brake protein YcgR